MEIVFVIFLTVISFSGVIPASVLKKNPALTQLQESVSRRLFIHDSLNTYTLLLQSGLHVWLGNGRSLLAFPIVSNRLLKIKNKKTRALTLSAPRDPITTSPISSKSHRRGSKEAGTPLYQ